MRAKPNPGFLVIGAQKCGTSWLHHHLSTHPDLWMPPGKELEFFSYRHHLDEPGLEAYRARFEPAGERLAGEATASYFWTGGASPWCRLPPGFNGEIPATVRRLLGPELKLIVSLRDPVERALSAWAHYIVHGEVDPGTPLRDAAGYGGIVDMGFYGRHLEQWRNHFPADHVLVLTLEQDIAQRPIDTLARCFEFLGVSSALTNEEQLPTPVFPGPRRRVHRSGDVLVTLPQGGELRVSADDIAWLRSLYEEDRERLVRCMGPGWSCPWPVDATG